MSRTLTRTNLLAAGLGLAAFLGMLALSDRTPDVVALIAVASVGVAVTGVLMERNPVAAVGVLFVLASMSDAVIPLPVGRVRLEQPAVVGALMILILRGRLPGRELRAIWPIALAFGSYLLVLTISSIVHAPEPLVSARMIVWTGLSMMAGLLAFTLLVRQPTADPSAWFVATGLGHAAVAAIIALAFLIVGPEGIPGMQTSPGEVPKVSGLAFEANLMASMLGAIAPFAMEDFRRRQSPRTTVALVLIVIGLGLGVTRGAYAGLAVGIVVYAAVIVWRGLQPATLRPLVPVLAAALLLAPTVSAVSLPTSRSNPPPVVPSVTPTRAPTHPARTPAATHTPVPIPSPTADTFAYRTNRIPVALRELQTSPLIGLGAASYGQRHKLANELSGLPDYIGILAVVAAYESGLIGTLALATGFLLALWTILRPRISRVGASAAYGASIVSLLVAYQATNALFFSLIWILTGTGLALAVRRRRALKGAGV